MPSVVTFDAGLTLIDLDLDMLAQRLAERGVSVEPHALGRAAPVAWKHYDTLAPTSTHPWQSFMAKLLSEAGVGDPQPLADWLFTEQPKRNLFRKPIEPMIELTNELAARGVVLAVLSNSEGTLAELLTEIGIASPFRVIIDSGRLPFAKPDRRIFDHTLATLGLPDAKPVHIGDSWPADVAAALAVGWNAIWYRSRAGADYHDPRARVAYHADDVRAALTELGVL